MYVVCVCMKETGKGVGGERGGEPSLQGRERD